MATIIHNENSASVLDDLHGLNACGCVSLLGENARWVYGSNRDKLRMDRFRRTGAGANFYQQQIALAESEDQKPTSGDQQLLV